MRVFDALGPRRSTTRVCKCNDGLFVFGLGIQRTPSLRAALGVVLQPFQYRAIKRPAQLSLGGIRVRVHKNRHARVGRTVRCEQVLELKVSDDDVDLSMLENVLDVIRLEPIVDANGDGASRRYAEDGLQEGRGICAKDAHALMVVLAQVVREPAGAVGGLDVGAAEDSVVSRHMVDCGRLYHGREGEPVAE